MTHSAAKFGQRSTDVSRAAYNQARLALYAFEEDLRINPLCKGGRKFFNLEDTSFFSRLQKYRRVFSNGFIQGFDTERADHRFRKSRFNEHFPTHISRTRNK